MDATPNTPSHIAIIMDGNGRWAAARGLPRVLGHRAGAAAVLGLVMPWVQALIVQLPFWDSQIGAEIGLLLGLLVASRRHFSVRSRALELGPAAARLGATLAVGTAYGPHHVG